jgi:hypothetical protein
VEPGEIDTTVPQSGADPGLGGKDNYAADRIG